MMFDKLRNYSKTKLNALSNGEITITYEELYQRLINNQQNLYDYGFHKGDVVILKLKNQIDFVIAFLSLLSIPCWVIPVADDIILDDLEQIIKNYNAKLFDDSIYKEIYIVSQVHKELRIPNSEEGGIYHMTSGSTGKSKFCVRTIEHLSMEGETFKKAFCLKQSESVLSAAPVYHSFALGAALMASVISGSLLYVVDKFIPRKILKLIDSNGIEILILVPAMVRALCNTYTKKNYSLESLRIPLVGAGPVTEEVYETMKEKYNVILYSNYGSTETGGIISRFTPQPYSSIGKPMEGVSIKICDRDHTILSQNKEGELWVKSPYMMKYYLSEKDAVIDSENFLYMGDLAYMDNEGNVYITGRIKCIINIGGKKVNPKEIENTILKYPSVEECIVTGDKKENGEEVVKAVVAGKNIDKRQLYKHCLDSLSRYKCPSVIKLVDKLPRNSLGKIRSELI